jgi:hypothetical protein
VACNSGQVDIVKALIAAKADINSKNGVAKADINSKNGVVSSKVAKKVLEEETPLFKASFLGNDAIVAVLIEAKADVNLCRKSVLISTRPLYMKVTLSLQKKPVPFVYCIPRCLTGSSGHRRKAIDPSQRRRQFPRQVRKGTLFSLCKSVAFIKYVQFLCVF